MEFIEYKIAWRKAVPLSMFLLLPGFYFTYIIFVSSPRSPLFLFIFIFFTFIIIPSSALINTFTKPFHLKITKQGIVNNYSLFSNIFIPWERVDKITFGGSGRFRDLQYYLKLYLTKQTTSRYVDTIRNVFLRKHGEDVKIMIPISLLEKPPQTIETEIRQFIKDNNLIPVKK